MERDSAWKIHASQGTVPPVNAVGAALYLRVRLVLFAPQRRRLPVAPRACAARTFIGRVLCFRRNDTIRSPRRGLSRRRTTPPGGGPPPELRAGAHPPPSPVARRPDRATRWWFPPSRFEPPRRCHRIPLASAALRVSGRQAAPGIRRRMRCMRRPLPHRRVGGCERRRAMRRGSN